MERPDMQQKTTVQRGYVIFVGRCEGSSTVRRISKIPAVFLESFIPWLDQRFSDLSIFCQLFFSGLALSCPHFGEYYTPQNARIFDPSGERRYWMRSKYLFSCISHVPIVWR